MIEWRSQPDPLVRLRSRRRSQATTQKGFLLRFKVVPQLPPGSVRREWALILAILMMVPAVLTPLVIVAETPPTVTVLDGAQAGQPMEVIGADFQDGSMVAFTWDGSPTDWLPAATADEDGTFRVTAVLPGRLAPRVYSLAAQELDADGNVRREATTNVEVTAGAAIDPPRLVPSVTPEPTARPTRTPRPTPTPTPTAEPTAPPAAAPAAPSAPPATLAPTAPPTIAGGAPAPVGVAGYGAAAKGGAGGKVIAVTNLNDSGSGSLRAALEASGPRTVVFEVGGTIQLAGDLRITNPFVTIDGSTAPRPVVIRDGMLLIAAPEVIVRHLRLRPGDQVSSPADADAVSINGLRGDVYNVVLDHLTMIWGPDIGGLAILGGAHDITVQYSIMGEGLYLSRHPEAKASEGGHSMGANIVQMTADGPWPERITLHHNLFTTSDSRMPRVQGGECIDLVNNVVYNWGVWAASGNPRAMNLVNNWFRAGPEMATPYAYRWQKQADLPDPFPGSVYQAGNVGDGFTYAVDAPDGVLRSNAACGGLSTGVRSAQDAYNTVISAAGATLPARDAVDQRIITNVLNRTGSFFNGSGHPAPVPYYP
jgi:pectate lyase